jgi:hypothetical protein
VVSFANSVERQRRYRENLVPETIRLTNIPQHIVAVKLIASGMGLRAHTPSIFFITSALCPSSQTQPPYFQIVATGVATPAKRLMLLDDLYSHSIVPGGFEVMS